MVKTNYLHLNKYKIKRLNFNWLIEGRTTTCNNQRACSTILPPTNRIPDDSEVIYQRGCNINITIGVLSEGAKINMLHFVQSRSRKFYHFESDNTLFDFDFAPSLSYMKICSKFQTFVFL